MGNSKSRISPSAYTSEILQNYHPSFISLIFRSKSTILVNATFTNPKDTESFSRPAKETFLTVQREHAKLVSNLSPLDENMSTTVLEYGNPNQPTLLILQDWGRRAYNSIAPSFLQAAQASFHIVILDFYSNPQFKKRNPGSFLIHALASCEYEYNPEFVLVHALASPLFALSLSYGLFTSTTSTVYVSPIDDFNDFYRAICKDLRIDHNTAIEKFEKRFGIQLPTLSRYISSTPQSCIVYSLHSQKEHKDATACKNSKGARVKVFQIDADTGDFLANASVIEKVLSFYRTKGQKNSVKNSVSSLSSSAQKPPSRLKTAESFNESWTRAPVPQVVEEVTDELWVQEEIVVPTRKRVKEIEQESISLDSLINELEGQFE